jgi:hypothetical protein
MVAPAIYDVLDGQRFDSLPPPRRLSTKLFASAKPVRLVAGKALFLAGDSGDDCYRIEDGLLKVTTVSRSGDEGILAFVGQSQLGQGDARLRTLPQRRALCMAVGLFHIRTQLE